MTEQDKDEAARWARMVDAEERAFALLDAVEAAGIMKPGRTEGEVDRDIEAIAAEQFGIARNWHQRLVRAGPNTTCIFSDMPDEVTIGAEDTVYIDMGPVFEQAEADVGRTYAMGQDPARRALVAALPDVFEEMRAFTLSKPDVTGAEVYDFACRAAGGARLSFRRQDRRAHCGGVPAPDLAAGTGPPAPLAGQPGAAQPARPSRPPPLLDSGSPPGGTRAAVGRVL
jgi:Xaa-Pro aminopeptidase